MPTQTRINSIDLLRGIVMIIMALDHTRDFFHVTAWTDDPLNLNTTTPALYFTRWITHLCAPTFVFLSGTSAYFVSLRKSKKQLSIFLLTRGLWLILVELVIMTLGISFDIHYDVFILQVIWAIGISMVILSAVVWLPFPLILALGVLIVAGHNSLDYYEATKADLPFLYKLIHQPGPEHIGSQTILIFYPFLAWTGAMILGYCFGRFYLKDVMNRNRRSMMLGASLVVLFIILRCINEYGNPAPWSFQSSSLYTFFSFMKVQKYPPSLMYLSVTIGISLIILGLIGNVKNRFADFVTVYGRVPLFYYVLHFYVLHFACAFVFLMHGHTIEEGMRGLPGAELKFTAPGEGYGLGIVYLVWLAVVLLLYPLCKWFADYKKNNRQWWLSYL